MYVHPARVVGAGGVLTGGTLGTDVVVGGVELLPELVPVLFGLVLFWGLGLGLELVFFAVSLLISFLSVAFTASSC